MPNQTRNSPSTPVIAVLLLVAAVLGGLGSGFIRPAAAARPRPLIAKPLGRRADACPSGQGQLAGGRQHRVEQPSPAEQNPLLQDPFFRRYMGVPDTAMQPVMSAGSGAIVDGARGLVITNFHVVRNARTVEVGLKDGRHFAAEPVALLRSSTSRCFGSVPRACRRWSSRTATNWRSVIMSSRSAILWHRPDRDVRNRQRDQPDAGAGRSAPVHPDRCADQSGQQRRAADRPHGKSSGSTRPCSVPTADRAMSGSASQSRPMSCGRSSPKRRKPNHRQIRSSPADRAAIPGVGRRPRRGGAARPAGTRHRGAVLRRLPR